MLTLLINLAESQERLLKMDGRLQELGIKYERVEAVNGKTLTPKNKDLLTYPYNHFESKVRYTRELTDGEIGCFLSHRACWEKLVSSKENFALIMEDDIEISDSASKYLLSSEWIPSSVDICQFSCLEEIQKGRIKNEILKIDELVSLVAPIYPIPLGSQCYLISKRAAKTALMLSKRFPCPVDDFLFSPWFWIEKKFIIWRTAPTLVVPNKLLKSTIGLRTKKYTKKAPFFVRHGLTRFILDWKIRKSLKQGVQFEFKFKK